MIKAIVSTLILTAAAVNVNHAHAVSVNLTKPDTSQIQVKVKDLVLKVEKSYSCALEGRPEKQGWFTSDTVDIQVTAVSLENAAELALTPFPGQIPALNGDLVTIQVEGKDKTVSNFFVRNINCKPVRAGLGI